MATAQLVTFGHWGDLERQPFVFNVDSLDIARQSRLAMGHGQSAADREAQPYWRGVRRLFEGQGAPLCLSWNRVYPSTWNDTSAWGGGTYLRRLAGRFGGNAYALSHERSQTTQNASYTSTFSILRNQPFSVRLWVAKAIDNSTAPVVSLKKDRWLLQAWPGTLSLARLASSWTQTIQDDLDTLVGAMENDSSAGWEAEIDEARNAHYESYHVLGSALSIDGGAFIDLEFVPEPLGALSVFLSSSRSQVSHTRVEIPALIEASDLAPNETQQIYAAGTITVRTKGPAFDFQVGQHLHGTALSNGEGGFETFQGQVLCPTRFVVDEGDEVGGELNDLTALLRKSTPAESDITHGLNDLGAWGFNVDGTPTTLHRYELSLDFSAPDARYTPFLYSGQLVLPALPHVGIFSEQSYDSDTRRILVGGVDMGSVFEDVQMSCEAETWARTYTVLAHDGAGIAFPLQRGYEALENRIANLEINGTQVLGHGLVVSAERGRMRTFTPNLPSGANVANVDAQAVLTIKDGFFILDEEEEMEVLHLDGLRLGAAARLLLQNGGWGSGQYSGMGAGYGRIIPSARLDEEPLVQTSGSRGAALRMLFEDWGMGARPYHGENGIWGIIEPSAAPVLALSKSASYASRLRVYGPLDFTRDFQEAYTEIVVIGGTNYRGETLAVTWTLYDGIKWQANSNQRFIGRRKRKVIERRNIRTRDHLLWVLRSNVARWGQTGRYASAEMHAYFGLRAGMAVTIDSQRYTIARIGDASAREDRMTVTFREDVQEV